MGAGVYYGAGASEASLCRNEDVFVAGGGNSTGQAALHFSRFAETVRIVALEETLQQSMSHYLIDRIQATRNIRVFAHTKVSALDGDGILREITLTDCGTGQQQTFATRWLFVCIGGAPHTDWAVEAGIQRDESGYLMTGPDLRSATSSKGWPLDRNPYYLETNVPGVFAAGDVRHGSVKRCASAVGEGAMAVASRTGISQKVERLRRAVYL